MSPLLTDRVYYLKSDFWVYPESADPQNEFLSNVKCWILRLFSSSFFNLIFGIFDDFSKFRSLLRCIPLWKIIKYGKNLAQKNKNEEKSCLICLTQLIFLHGTSKKKPKIQVFWVHTRSVTYFSTSLLFFHFAFKFFLVISLFSFHIE